MNEPIVFNKSLDREPMLFSVIPSNLLIPGTVFLLITGLLFLWLQLNWMICVTLFVVQIITWIMLTARGVHTFLSRFEKPPYWISSFQRVEPLLPVEYVDFPLIIQHTDNDY
jgi:hypothetical protein